MVSSNDGVKYIHICIKVYTKRWFKINNNFIICKISLLLLLLLKERVEDQQSIPIMTPSSNKRISGTRFTVKYA